MFLSADTMAYLLGLGLNSQQLVELVRRLDDDAKAVQPVSAPIDPVAERRRAYDRDRKRARAEIPPENSTGIPPEPLPPETKVPPDPLKNSTSNPPPSPPKGGSIPRLLKPNGFSRFWEAYPRKVGKRTAELAYDRAIRRSEEPDPPAAIFAGLQRAIASDDWRKEPQFIPHPTTWLNRDGWLDEIPSDSTGPPGTSWDKSRDAEILQRMRDLADRRAANA